jgi:hypothetical protein
MRLFLFIANQNKQQKENKSFNTDPKQRGSLNDAYR